MSDLHNQLPASVQALSEQAKTIREMSGGPVMREIVQLLDLIDASYKEELVNVASNRLEYAQAKTHQVRALRRLFSGASDTDGTV